MTAADVLSRREVVAAPLAAMGGYHGQEQDFWWAWLAVTRDGGADPAERARALRPAQASWLAMWCFAVGDVDLGCTLFEDLVERPGIAVGGDLHHHLVVLCLLWHLVHRRPAAALRVGDRYLARRPTLEDMPLEGECQRGGKPGLDPVRRGGALRPV